MDDDAISGQGGKEGAMQAMSVAAVEAELDLVTRHRYGDPEAFAEIYGRFGTMVFQIARRMSGDVSLAEDLSQEIFLRIFKHLDTFRGKSSLKTWVYRVAINCCRSRLGRSARRGRAFIDVEAESFDRMPAPGEGTDARLARRESHEVIGRGLAQLPLDFREAVILRDISGLSYEEIAKVLGLRLGTVRSRIARGRDRLRAAIMPEDAP
jgi:RNA polymerase sigma-70 factor, ECF subfamily